MGSSEFMYKFSIVTFATSTEIICETAIVVPTGTKAHVNRVKQIPEPLQSSNHGTVLTALLDQLITRNVYVLAL